MVIIGFSLVERFSSSQGYYWSFLCREVFLFSGLLLEFPLQRGFPLLMVIIGVSFAERFSSSQGCNWSSLCREVFLEFPL